ncbi:hypothetical protein C0075_25480, partial [Rhizobium sp. KAs_5_22]
ATANDLTADAGAAYVELLQAQHKRTALEQGMADLDRLRGIVAGRGRVQIADAFWDVSGPELPAGAMVRVVGADAMLLHVEAAG